MTDEVAINTTDKNKVWKSDIKQNLDFNDLSNKLEKEQYEKD